MDIENKLKVIQIYPIMFNDNDYDYIWGSITYDEMVIVLNYFSWDKSLGMDGWTMELFINFLGLMGSDMLF